MGKGTIRALGLTGSLLGVLAAGCGGEGSADGGPWGRTGAAGAGGVGAGGGGAGAGRGGTGGSRPDGGVSTAAVDILFLIDNSVWMAPPQAAFKAALPRLVSMLEALPGGFRDAHLAVISSNMGAGNGTISACNGRGDDGTFQYRAQSPCLNTTLASGATFLRLADGATNFTGPLADALACVAILGDTGCGFEQHLLSLTRALGADGYSPPAENANFLREDARLVIVILANEDDCSARGGAADQLFTTDQRTLATALGPVGSFRCNEFGHRCSEGTPSRLAPNGAVTDTRSYTNCVSNEDSAFLAPVTQFVLDINRLKAAPERQIFVLGIVGVRPDAPNGPIPYQVHWAEPALADTGPWPAITHSCVVSGSNPEHFGDPPVRLAEFVRQFGDNGHLYSVCADDYAPAFGWLAEKLGK